MTDLNIEATISNDEPNLPLSVGDYFIEASNWGLPLGIHHYQRGPAGQHLLRSQPPNLPEVIVQGQGIIGTNDPLTASDGPEYSIPLKLKALDSDYEHWFSIEDKINRYYNDALIQYDDNGTTKQMHLYSPDDVADIVLDNYVPGTYTFDEPPELEQFLQNYQSMLQDETLEKRMSHYNQNWEENNQIILDALNNQNGLQMQQILWNVYDFT